MIACVLLSAIFLQACYCQRTCFPALQTCGLVLAVKPHTGSAALSVSVGAGVVSKVPMGHWRIHCRLLAFDRLVSDAHGLLAHRDVFFRAVHCASG